MSVTFEALIADYKSFKDDAREFGFAAVHAPNAVSPNHISLATSMLGLARQANEAIANLETVGDKEGAKEFAALMLEGAKRNMALSIIDLDTRTEFAPEKLEQLEGIAAKYHAYLTDEDYEGDF